MIRADDIDKDITTLSERYKVAAFTYDNIHNPEINNRFHYDYKKVISEVARINNITYQSSETQLVERGVLKPLPFGEYEIEVGESTRSGGGLNYNGKVFFSYSNDDYHSAYHELAHSLQKIYKLFDKEKIDRLYEISGQTLNDKTHKNKKLINRYDYVCYLNELHAGAFGSAALMLRADNRRDFLQQVVATYNMGQKRNQNALRDIKKQTYNSEHDAKFYATKSITKPLIKAIYKIRQSGERDSFFDENGVLNAEKLAKLCENIVLNHAYSPRTLNAFFKNNIFDGHSKHEKGWRKDALKTLFETPLTLITNFHKSESDKKTSFKMHKKLLEQQYSATNDFLLHKNTYEDLEFQALKEYEKILVAASYFGTYKENVSEALMDNIQQMSDYDIPNSAIRTIAQDIGDDRQEQKFVMNAFKFVRNIYRNNKDNPYFKKLTHLGIKTIIPIQNMIASKEKYPKHNFIDAFNKPSSSSVSYSSPTMVVKTQLDILHEFAQQYKISPDTSTYLMKELITNPTSYDTKKFRDEVAQQCNIKFDIFGLEKKRFIKDLNQTFDLISYNNYINYGSQKYKNLLYDLSKYQPNNYLTRLKEIDEKKIPLLGKVVWVKTQHIDTAAQTSRTEQIRNHMNGLRQKLTYNHTKPQQHIECPEIKNKYNIKKDGFER